MFLIDQQVALGPALVRDIIAHAQEHGRQINTTNQGDNLYSENNIYRKVQI